MRRQPNSWQQKPSCSTSGSASGYWANVGAPTRCTEQRAGNCHQHHWMRVPITDFPIPRISLLAAAGARLPAQRRVPMADCPIARASRISVKPSAMRGPATYGKMRRDGTAGCLSLRRAPRLARRGVPVPSSRKRQLDRESFQAASHSVRRPRPAVPAASRDLPPAHAVTGAVSGGGIGGSRTG